MKETLHFNTSVFYMDGGKELIRTFFMESHGDALTIASLFAETHEVRRLRLTVMHYGSPAGANHMNEIEWYGWDGGCYFYERTDTWK